MSKRFFSREFTNFIDNPNINPIKINMLFGSIINLDTNEIRSISSINQIPISTSDEDNNNLIHKVLYDDSKQKNEDNRLNVIKFLVENNVNPEQPNHENITPLHIACLKQYKKIVKYLLSLNVTPDYPDNLGNTPFHYYLSGLIKPYEDNQIYNLIPEERTTEKINSDKEIRDIEKIIWNDISDSSGISAMKKTMNYTFLLNENIKESINKIFKEITGKGKLTKNKKTDLKMYKEKIVQLYLHITSQLLDSSYWNKFKGIDEININYNTNSYINDFTSTEEYCRNKINNSIDTIIDGMNELNDSIQEKPDNQASYNVKKFQMDNSLLGGIKHYFKGIGYNYNKSDISENLRDNSNGYHKFLSFLNSEIIELPDFCMDYADNYIDLKKNIFIGGSRRFNLSNDISMNDLSNTFKNNLLHKLTASFATGIFNETVYNRTTFDFSNNNGTNKLHELFYKDMFSTDTFVDINDLSNFDKAVFLRNNKYIKNDYFKQFNCLYNLFLNNQQNKKIGNNRLSIEVSIETLMGFGGYINYLRNPNSNNVELAISQAFRPMYLKNMNGIDSSNLSNLKDDISGSSRYLSTWIYLLLTEETTDQINYNIVNTVNNNLVTLLNNANSDKAVKISKYCNLLLRDEMDDQTNTDMSEICGNKNFESRYEKLVYGITKVYSEMIQKPIELHLIDTIFIIRQIAESLLNGRDENKIKEITQQYLPTIYIDKNIEVNDINTYISPNLSNNADLFKDSSNIYHVHSSILPSRQLLFSNFKIRKMHDGVMVDDDYKKYYLDKFMESYLLGVNFYCCFERIDNEIKLFDDTNNHIFNNRTYHLDDESNFDNLVNNNPRIVFPYAGFMYDRGGGLSLLKKYVINKDLEIDKDIGTYKYDYFAITDQTKQNYRPATSDNLESTRQLLKDLLEYQVLSILGSENLINYETDRGFQNFKNEIDFLRIIGSYKRKIKSNKLTKLLPFYYPVFSGLNNHMLNLNKFVPNLFNLGAFMNDIINEINSINAYFFINYYTNYSGNDIYIPSFFYYKIPKIPNLEDSYFRKEKTLIFDSSNTNANLSIESIYNYNLTPSDTSNASGQYFNQELNNKGTPSKAIGIKSILNGNKYVTFNSIKKYMKISKREALPPSLKGYFYDFYKLNTLETIMQMDASNLAKDEIQNLNELYKITPELNELDFKFKRAKIVEKTTSRYLQWYVKNNTVRLLKKFFEKNNINDVSFGDFEIPHIFDDTDFTVSLNKIPNQYPSILPDDKKGSGLSIFRINEYIEKDKGFLLYSNDYTLNNLERNYNTVSIEETIIKDLLDSGANPLVKNEMNRTAIKNVLLNYYYPIFDALNNEDTNISYNMKNNIDVNNNNDMPHIYVLEELYNHSNKLVFNSNNNKEILEKFTFAQYQEIELIIKNNEKFGNNILRNLKTSYSVVAYITNQYLFRSLFSSDYNDTNIIKNILGDFKIDATDISNNIYKINDYVNDVSQSDYSTAINEYISTLDNEINKINKKHNNLNNKIIDISGNYDKIFKETLVNSLKELEVKKAKQNDLKNDIMGLSRKSDKFQKRDADTYDIIKFYDNLIKDNDYNRGSYMELWKVMLEKEKKDINMVMIEYTKDISKYCEESIELKGVNANLDDILEKYFPFFKYLEKTSDNYFKTPKYIGINKSLKFIKKVLIHMTQNVLCFGFEVAIKKCMFEYYINKFGSDNIDMIYTMIEGSFNSIMRADNKDMREILYCQVAQDLVINSTNVFETRNDEVNHTLESPKEIYTNYINLLSASQLQIDDDSKLITNLNVIVSYFDAITTNTINRWHVVMENTMKFGLNQSRIMKTINGLYNK